MNPVLTSSPRTSSSSMTSRRSPVTQARSGAEKEALGRFMISSGSHARAASLRATLPVLLLTLRSPAKESGSEDDRVDERHPDLGRCGHARPVGVRQVKARQEKPCVGQAHTVDVVGEVVVAVDLKVVLHQFVHVEASCGAHDAASSTGS